MGRYGTDKPDLRFDLRVQDAHATLQGSDFRLFAGTGGHRAAHSWLPRTRRRLAFPAELDELQEVARARGRRRAPSG